MWPQRQIQNIDLRLMFPHFLNPAPETRSQTLHRKAASLQDLRRQVQTKSLCDLNQKPDPQGGSARRCGLRTCKTRTTSSRSPSRPWSHPTPCTLHPTPYTLHPTPHTLNPTPYTLHPTPNTLHPTPPLPCTLHHYLASTVVYVPSSLDSGGSHK